MRKSIVPWLLGLLVLVISCTKKTAEDLVMGNQSNGTDLIRNAFTVIPFDTIDITALVPLGNLNPPTHTFPTDHMYFYCFTNLASLNIKSPGHVTIFRITRIRYDAGAPNERVDYSIAMGSDKSYLYWSHVSQLSPRLLAAVNNFASAKCEKPYATGGTYFEPCYLELSLTATPGETLGIAKTKNGLAGIDFGAVVNGTGTNPLDFFDASARAQLEPKLGRFDGKVKRTILPLYGESMQDILTTAMGNWYRQGMARQPEDNHIALVKDNIDPTKQAFSVGNNQKGLPSGVYYFNPENSGYINRHFAEVKADGNTYCYSLGIPNFPFPGNSLIPSTSIIIRMENGTTLSLEKRNCDCSCAPYLFSSNKATFTR